MRLMIMAALAVSVLVGSATAQTAASPQSGADLFGDRCSFCHLDGPGGQGPSLTGVVGRKAGSVADFGYSPALKASGLVWTPENLDKFLTDPGAMVPGAAMPIHVPDAATRQAIIGYLATKK